MRHSKVVSLFLPKQSVPETWYCTVVFLTWSCGCFRTLELCLYTRCCWRFRFVTDFHVKVQLYVKGNKKCLWWLRCLIFSFTLFFSDVKNSCAVFNTLTPKMLFSYLLICFESLAMLWSVNRALCVQSSYSSSCVYSYSQSICCAKVCVIYSNGC